MKLIIAGSRTFCDIPKKPKPACMEEWKKYQSDYEKLQSYVAAFICKSTHGMGLPATEVLTDSSITFKYDIPLEVVSGTATGADQAGERFADEHNVRVERFRPEWALQGKKAGILRNLAMARYATHAIIFNRGNSAGSRHMANAMKKLGKPYQVVEV